MNLCSMDTVSRPTIPKAQCEERQHQRPILPSHPTNAFPPGEQQDDRFGQTSSRRRLRSKARTNMRQREPVLHFHGPNYLNAGLRRWRGKPPREPPHPTGAARIQSPRTATTGKKLPEKRVLAPTRIHATDSHLHIGLTREQTPRPTTPRSRSIAATVAKSKWH